MQIADKTVVGLDYKLTIDDGVLVDASDKGQPLFYLHGVGQLIPGLERELLGLSAGDSKTVVVKPEDGYGVRDDERMHNVPKAQFGENAAFELGHPVMAQSPDGHQIQGRISEIHADHVIVDFNHELAGKELTFNVTVAAVRAPTEDELKHGHAHGADGHAQH